MTEKKTQKNTVSSEKSFKDFNLSPVLQEVLIQNNFTHPSEMQAKLLPRLLEEKKALVQAPTGTGKTLAFVLPALETLLHSYEDPFFSQKQPPLAVIIAPTRELVRQTGAFVAKFSKNLDFKVLTSFAGSLMPRKFSPAQADILIATPGRLLTFLEKGILSHERICFTAFDEADKLFSPEFMEETLLIRNFLPEESKLFLLSATFSSEKQEEIKAHFGKMPFLTLKNISTKEKLPPIRQQAVILTRSQEKFPLLLKQSAEEALPKGTIIFTNTRKEAENLFKELKKNAPAKTPPVLLHGGLTEEQRRNAIKKFEHGLCCWLITTDVTARGLNLSKASLILNYDLPQTAEAYIHRIGRTGRAGKRGEAISFIAPDDRKNLLTLERRLSQHLRAITPQQFSKEVKKLSAST